MRPDTTAPSFEADGARTRLLALLKLPYEYFVFYCGLALFGLLTLTLSLVSALLYPLLPRRTGEALGQAGIQTIFRIFLLALRASRLVKCDLRELDALRDQRSLVIAPNHPSLLDVVFVAARLSHVTCIMKAEIWDNIFLGASTRLAGYIRNDSPGRMIREAANKVREGSQLLIFPEGTRTRQLTVNDFKGGFALIAKTAGVPVQTVFIEANSAFLSKGWPLCKKPCFPLEYRVRLGERFEVKGDVKTFVAELEDYYRKQQTSGATAGHSKPATNAPAVSSSRPLRAEHDIEL
jgi:1-acyl-sn-glycerol-3-phosphate acyltransferase